MAMFILACIGFLTVTTLSIVGLWFCAHALDRQCEKIDRLNLYR